MRKFFAVTALMYCSQLQAQLVPLQRPDSTTLENVTLTANKFSTKTTETGKVVITISRKELDKAGSRDLAQVITELGGVFINGYSSNWGKEKNIYLRGAKVEHTLITVDGIPVYDATGIGSNFDIRNISVDNVERIEILKGSQSTLYGSDAIAGVINIITKRGGTKPHAVGGVVDYGTYKSLRANVNFSGSVNSFDYNIGLTRFRTDGFSEAQEGPNARQGYEKDSYSQNSVQANFGFQASDAFRIQPFIRYSRVKGSLDNDAFIDDKDFTNTNKNLQLGAKSMISLGKARINAIYQLTNTKRDYRDDSLSHDPTAYYLFNEQQYKSTEHFADAFVIHQIGKAKLTAGADLRISNTSYHATQKNIYSSQISTSAYSGDSVKQKQVGVYAALNYSYNNFNIEGGGRLNNHSEYGTNFAFNVNPSFVVDKRAKLFVNISSGYKTPSLYQLFSVYGNKKLQPETSLNLEGGVQVFTLDEKASIRATYFNRKVSDAIAFFFDPNTFRSNYINQDKQNDHGFEVDGRLNMAGGKLQLKALYSYVDGKITTKQAGKDTTYFNLLRRPKSTFNFSAGSQLTKSFYVNAQLNIVGSRSDVYFDPVTFGRKDLKLDAYTLLNFYAEYGVCSNRIKLFVDLRNVLDKKYVDIYGYNTAAFNAYGGVRFQF